MHLDDALTLGHMSKSFTSGTTYARDYSFPIGQFTVQTVGLARRFCPLAISSSYSYHYLFFLLFLLLVLLFHHLWVCAVPFPFRGRCASNTRHPLCPILATTELCVGITRTEPPRGKSIRAATAPSVRSREFPRLSLLQLRELNHRATMSCTAIRILVVRSKSINDADKTIN